MHSYLYTSHPPQTPSQHRHHSIIFVGRPFPLPPPPLKCTQLNAHSATPTSLPDNTTAWPSHNIHAHAPHTFIHSSAFSSLLAEMPEQCKCARARQSAMIILSMLRLLRQVASSGNGNSNKVNEGESKRWWTTFLSHNDLGQKCVHDVQSHPEATRPHIQHWLASVDKVRSV